MQKFFQRCKEFCNTPAPVYPPSYSISIGLKVVLFFCVFYFIFNFGHIPEKVSREIIDFSSIVFGLFSSVLMMGVLSFLYLRISGNRLIPVFGYSIFEFIFIYTGMVVLLGSISLNSTTTNSPFPSAEAIFPGSCPT